MTALATVGHNGPPSPYEQSKQRVDDLYEEAKNWLDGESIDRQELADEISKLLAMIRDAKKEADSARKEEAKPFDDGKKEVQERYKPLLEMADRAADACKKALTPWLEKVEAEKRAQEAEAKRIAEETARAAQEAMRSTTLDDLEGREQAEKLAKEAKRATAAANRAGRDTAKAGGVALRRTYEPELVSGVEAARHYWQHNREAMEAFLLDLARKDVRSGVRSIPGFTITEKKGAV